MDNCEFTGCCCVMTVTSVEAYLSLQIRERQVFAMVYCAAMEAAEGRTEPALDLGGGSTCCSVVGDTSPVYG